MKVHKGEIDTNFKGIKYWNPTLNKEEILYGHEEMLVSDSVARNQAILKAQVEHNGGLNNGQTNDLIAMIKDANDFLCQTNRHHMLGSFDMTGLQLDAGTSMGYAEPLPAPAGGAPPARSMKDNDEEPDKNPNKKKNNNHHHHLVQTNAELLQNLRPYS